MRWTARISGLRAASSRTASRARAISRILSSSAAQISMKRILTDLDFAAYYKEEKRINKFFVQELGFESQEAALTPLPTTLTGL